MRSSLIFVSVLVALSFAKLCLVFAIAPWFPDFSVFWTAARFAMNSPHLLYDGDALTAAQSWVGLDGPRPWAYPPTALLPILPLAAMPFKWAYATFTAASLLAFGAATKALLGDRWKLGVPLALISYPVAFAAYYGQFSILIGALVIGGLVLLKDSPRLAGAMLGVAAALKPQLLVLAPLALMSAREWLALSSAVGAGLLTVALTMPLGIGLWFDWINSLPAFVETVRELGILGRAVTPTGMLWNAGIGGQAQAAALLFASFAAYAVWKIFGATEDPAIRLVALIGGALWCTPYAMNYEVAILAPAAVALILRKPLWLVIVATLPLVAFKVFAPPAVTVFIGAVLMSELLGSGKGRSRDTIPAVGSVAGNALGDA